MEPVFLVYNRIGTLHRNSVEILKDLRYEMIFEVGNIQDTIGQTKEYGKNAVILLELAAGLSRINKLDFVKSNAFKYPIIVSIPVVDHQFILQFHDAGARKILLKIDDNIKFSQNLKNILDELQYAVSSTLVN